MSSQSLPSFAQAFHALDDRDRALPPIHSHTHFRHDSRHEARHDSSRGPSLPPLKRESKKRGREPDDSSDLSSPSIVKQEQDIDQLEPSPPPQPPPKAPSPSKPTRTRQQLHLNTSIGNNNNAGAQAAGATTNSNTTATNTNVVAPPPPQSIVRQHHPAPPSKRRRVTISGVAHPNMHASNYTFDPGHTSPPPSTHTGPSTPISPVVMGFTIQRDPQAVEQVRAMLAVKQQQKAIIESRRGSAAGLAGNEGSRRGSIAGIDSAGRRASVAAPSVTVNVVNPTPTTATGPGPAQTPAAPPLRRSGSSPNGHRLAPTPPTMSPKARANAARTRSPSLLGGARVSSPSQHGVSSRAAALPPASTSTNSNLSPPSHHPTRPPQPSPQIVSGRPQMPSPPQPAPPSASSSTNPQNQGQNQHSPYGSNQGFSALANNLPPPPNSFTRRRAGQLIQRGNKPADLMISPRETESGPVPSGHKTSGISAAPHNPPHTAQAQQQTQTHNRLPPQRGGTHVPSVHVSSSFRNLQPAIQSAPPRPGQQPGRFPMALPTLPPAIGVAVSGGAAQRTASIRKAGGQVPPTPTRLSMQRAQGMAESAPVRLSHPTGLSRVPRTATGASFAVPHGPAAASGAGSSSSAKMPGTPATLHRASGAGASADKAAFLAPFEQFFDALSDAQVLKGWFSEQLRRVGALAKESEAQVTRLKAVGGESSISRSDVENLVREAVQQEARAWRDEVIRLRTQMVELQETIQDLRSTDAGSGTAKGKGRPVNGLSPRPHFQPTPPTSSASTFPTAPGVESYTFPPVPRPPTGPGTGTGPVPGASSSAPMHTANPRNELPSPPQGRDTSDSMSGYGRSVSRSAASSPAPSFDGGVGISRRLSVSAMRFEPQKQLPLVLVDRNDTLEENNRERRREMEKKEKEMVKQGVKMAGSYGSGLGSRSNVGGGGGDVGSAGRSDERHDSFTAAAGAESPMAMDDS